MSKFLGTAYCKAMYTQERAKCAFLNGRLAYCVHTGQIGGGLPFFFFFFCLLVYVRHLQLEDACYEMLKAFSFPALFRYSKEFVSYN